MSKHLDITNPEKIERIKQLETKLESKYNELGYNENVKFTNYFDPTRQGKNKVDNLNELMYKMMFHSQNSGRKRNSIKLENNRAVLENVLCKLSPKEICEKFDSSDEIYKELKSKVFVGNSAKTWENYSKTIYEIAYFLNNFDNVDEFKEIIKLLNNKAPYALLGLIQSIYGYGKSLSEDFIKESGCTNYIKTDIHLSDFLKKVFDIEIKDTINLYKSVDKICKDLGNWTPYKFDKVIYLSCTLDFYLNESKKPKSSENNARKKRVIEFVKNGGELNL